MNRVLVPADMEPVAQLHQVVKSFDLDPNAFLFSKCIRCTVSLESVPDRDTIKSRVHPNVFARFETFYQCPRCDTVFWKGTHVRNTCRKLKLEGMV